MQLISLSANDTNFKTIHFKENGINIILAKQKEPESSQRGDTTNGVGKSLIIAIIHFCLGSNSKAAFKDKLPDWEFTLEFKINNKIYKSSRSTSNQGVIFLNGLELKQTDFCKKLEDLLLDISKEASSISFRSVLNFFLRSNEASYNSEIKPHDKWTEFQAQVLNAFLLGLDVDLALEKSKIKEEIDYLTKLINELKKDDEFLSYVSKQNEFDFEKKKLKNRIAQKEKNLKAFEIADDYEEIKDSANKAKTDLDDLINAIDLIDIQTRNLKNSLKQKLDLRKEKIVEVYNEAKVVFKENTVKQLSELESFYEHLVTNRNNRLLKQINDLELSKRKLTAQRENIKDALDRNLQYLDTHRALDTYLAISNEIRDLTTKLDSIEKYTDLFETYSVKLNKLKAELKESHNKAHEYTKEAQKAISEIDNFFKELIQKVYPNVFAAINISNNDKDNKIRYNISAKIEYDRSDGISSVKIFCYDLTLLLKGLGHHFDFLFHDSKLLDGVDPRQVKEMFLILDELIAKNQKQYIISVNSNQLDDFEEYIQDANLYKKIVTDNIILTLGDRTPDEKLLGFQVDMNYD